MTKAQEYTITFYKAAEFGSYYFSAIATNTDNIEIANFIDNCEKRTTEIQIEDLEKAIAGELYRRALGRSYGITVGNFSDEGTVQIGYTNRRIPIQDFKKLLEEWLEFSTS